MSRDIGDIQAALAEALGASEIVAVVDQQT